MLLHRREDSAFDEACREAIAVAKMMLVDDESRKPTHPHWIRHDGHELVVSGTNVGTLAAFALSKRC